MNDEYNWRWTCRFCGHKHRHVVTLGHHMRHIAFQCRRCNSLAWVGNDSYREFSHAKYYKQWLRDAERLRNRFAAYLVLKKMVSS